jgi:glycosyltransferase involved in cell wall biosynthesis
LSSVLIANPSRQHAYQFALALESAGFLNSFFSLLPDEQYFSWLAKYFRFIVPSSVFRHSLEGIPRDKINILIGPLYFYKFSLKIKNNQIKTFFELAAWVIFDRWVASNLKRSHPKIVIGYEMCCLNTFLVAKKLGVKCILDAAACHYQSVDDLLPEKITARDSLAGKQLRLRKNLEIQLADKIICASDLARDTYLKAGVDSKKLLVNAPGYDKKLFIPKSHSDEGDYVTFIFIGQPVYHKGFDVLVEAFNKLLLTNLRVKLLVVGSRELCDPTLMVKDINFLGRLSHQEIKYLFMHSDCLVLPSRCESFGMAALEAIGSGVPAIISKNAGVSMLIEEGVNGWTVNSGDVVDLYGRMKRCCDNFQSLKLMAKTCSATVESHDWSKYSARAIEIIDKQLIEYED